MDVTEDGRSCQQCTHQILTERKKRREWEAKQTFPRKRHVVFQGVGYSALMPSEVPDNAHLEIINHLNRWPSAVWKWTDEKTGKQMFMRSFAQEMERHDILTGNGQVVRSFYDAPRIGTEVVKR